MCSVRSRGDGRASPIRELEQDVCVTRLVERAIARQMFASKRHQPVGIPVQVTDDCVPIRLDTRLRPIGGPPEVPRDPRRSPFRAPPDVDAVCRQSPSTYTMPLNAARIIRDRVLRFDADDVGIGGV